MTGSNIGGCWSGRESNASPDLNFLRVVLKEKVLESEEMIEVGDIDEVRTDTPLRKENIESMEHREGVMGAASSDERSQFEPTM